MSLEFKERWLSKTVLVGLLYLEYSEAAAQKDLKIRHNWSSEMSLEIVCSAVFDKGADLGATVLPQ